MLAERFMTDPLIRFFGALFFCFACRSHPGSYLFLAWSGRKGRRKERYCITSVDYAGGIFVHRILSTRSVVMAYSNLVFKGYGLVTNNIKILYNYLSRFIVFMCLFCGELWNGGYRVRCEV